MTTYDKLIEYQRALKKIDTHEHIVPEQMAMRANTDIFDILLTPYNCDSVLSCGCSEEDWRQIMDKSAPFEKRWHKLSEHIEQIYHTAFFRATRRAFAAQYNVTEFNADNLRRADDALKREIASEHYGAYMRAHNIEAILTFNGYDSVAYHTDPHILCVPTVSDLLPRRAADIARLEAASGVRADGIDNMANAVDALFEQYRALGVRAVKFGSAYRRKLDYAPPKRLIAEKQLDMIQNAYENGDSKRCAAPQACRDYSELKALDDYLTDHIMRLCRKHGLPVVFHTAMHAWNENDPERAHARYLTNLIRRYPDVRFVLLHAGAPFFEEAVLLARYYANVYIDMTWFHIISPDLAQSAVRRLLELVPLNKVFAFGGDYCYIQSIAGHLEIAMENYARVFGNAIDSREMRYGEAARILEKWYYDNPIRFYEL